MGKKYFCLLLKYRISGETKPTFLNAKIQLELNSGCPFRHRLILQLVSPICVTCLLAIEFAIPGLGCEGVIDAGARRTSRCHGALAFLLVWPVFVFSILQRPAGLNDWPNFTHAGVESKPVMQDTGQNWGQLPPSEEHFPSTECSSASSISPFLKSSQWSHCEERSNLGQVRLLEASVQCFQHQDIHRLWCGQPWARLPTAQPHRNISDWWSRAGRTVSLEHLVSLTLWPGSQLKKPSGFIHVVWGRKMRVGKKGRKTDREDSCCLFSPQNWVFVFLCLLCAVMFFFLCLFFWCWGWCASVRLHVCFGSWRK